MWSKHLVFNLLHCIIIMLMCSWTILLQAHCIGKFAASVLVHYYYIYTNHISLHLYKVHHYLKPAPHLVWSRTGIGECVSTATIYVKVMVSLLSTMLCPGLCVMSMCSLTCQTQPLLLLILFISTGARQDLLWSGAGYARL